MHKISKTRYKHSYLSPDGENMVDSLLHDSVEVYYIS